MSRHCHGIVAGIASCCDGHTPDCYWQRLHGRYQSWPRYARRCSAASRQGILMPPEPGTRPPHRHPTLPASWHHAGPAPQTPLWVCVVGCGGGGVCGGGGGGRCGVWCGVCGGGQRPRHRTLVTNAFHGTLYGRYRKQHRAFTSHILYNITTA